MILGNETTALVLGPCSSFHPHLLLKRRPSSFHCSIIRCRTSNLRKIIGNPSWTMEFIIVHGNSVIIHSQLIRCGVLDCSCHEETKDLICTIYGRKMRLVFGLKRQREQKALTETIQPAMCIYVHIFFYIYECICICVYVFIYFYIYFIHTHTHTVCMIKNSNVTY